MGAHRPTGQYHTQGTTKPDNGLPGQSLYQSEAHSNVDKRQRRLRLLPPRISASNSSPPATAYPEIAHMTGLFMISLEGPRSTAFLLSGRLIATTKLPEYQKTRKLLVDFPYLG
ncbi:hypothetical protein ACN38_g8463 [Penicillium nordicum]|uniref:Uncharacterized protein n=1 Tax=Penicillium nordicum TaxID=229535 RepID=A0A0M8P3N4_9EURO|nr:hypothetical protein ACN38_g8463 [Penicillium nordicum]